MTNTFIKLSIAAISLGLLTGCASIIKGRHQNVAVQTGMVKGATCELENDKGKWYVKNTPGAVSVNRSYADLRVNCQKNGYRRAFKTVASQTNGAVYGNILVGGIIGTGIDVANGAAYDYPTQIDIPM